MADHDESKKRTADQSEAPEAKRSKVEGGRSLSFFFFFFFFCDVDRLCLVEIAGSCGPLLNRIWPVIDLLLL